jgi:hypothetical protein
MAFSCGDFSIEEKKMTVDQEQKVGEEIVRLLDLENDDDGRYKTSGGTKTEIGLCRTIQRIFDEQGAK